MNRLCAVLLLSCMAIAMLSPAAAQQDPTDYRIPRNIVAEVPARSAVSANGSMTLLSTIDTGGMPDAIVVERTAKSNDVIFFDMNGMRLRYLDGATLTLTADTISLPGLGFEAWMVHDRANAITYVVQRSTQFNPGTWYKVQLAAVQGRQRVATIDVNTAFNTTTAVDAKYAVQGLVLKQPKEEGDQPARLIVDNASRGLIDIVDVSDNGLAAARIQRYTYRADTTTLDSVRSVRGSSLALDGRHETHTPDDLTTADLLYIADHNERLPSGVYRNGIIKALRLSHPLADLAVTVLPEINLSGVWPYGNGVNGGLTAAGPRDLFYIASGAQSFAKGYVTEVSTLTNQPRPNIVTWLGDQGPVLVDWYDTQRAFVATYDGFAPVNDARRSLHLHLIYNGAVVDSLRLFDNYTEDSLRGMAFDPHARRLYLTVDRRILVVDVNYGAAPAPLPDAPLAFGTTTLQSPWYIGTLETNDGAVRLDFFPNAVSQETTVTCQQIRVPPDIGDQMIVYAFDLTAQYTADGAVTQFGGVAAFIFRFANQGIAQSIADTLALYRWDGQQWTKEPTSQVNLGQSQVAAQLNQPGRYAIMGTVQRVYLPGVLVH